MLYVPVLLIFPGAMALAAASDLFSMKIPNWIPLGLVAGFVLVAVLSGMTPAVAGVHALTALVALCVGFALFATGWIGGGDAKLFAATCLWLGTAQVLEYIVISGLVGGALTLALLTFRQFPLPRWIAGEEWIARLHGAGNGAPYGIALAVAGLIVYGGSPWMAVAG